MSKNTKQWVDWSKTPIKQPEDPRSEPVKRGKGDQILVNQFADLVRKMVGAPDPGPQMRQPTKEDELKMVKALFPDLPETEEELKKEQDDWIDGENPIERWHREVRKPVERTPLSKSDIGRGAIDPDMPEEEKRKLMTEEEWRIYKIPVSEGAK
jgi:hypothetical protein